MKNVTPVIEKIEFMPSNIEPIYYDVNTDFSFGAYKANNDAFPKEKIINCQLGECENFYYLNKRIKNINKMYKIKKSCGIRVGFYSSTKLIKKAIKEFIELAKKHNIN